MQYSVVTMDQDGAWYTPPSTSVYDAIKLVHTNRQAGIPSTWIVQPEDNNKEEGK